MVVKDDIYYFKIGGREIYFYRDAEAGRNHFGLTYEGLRVCPNFAKDELFEDNPKFYLLSVLAFLEQQADTLEEVILEEEEDWGFG